MKGMTLAGIALLVLGLAALVYGGIPYTQQETVVDFGPVEMTTENQESIAVPPVLGVALALAGGFLIWKGGRA